MTIHERLKCFITYIKNTAIFGGTSLFIGYHIGQTYNAIQKIVDTKVLDRDTQQAEYIYIDDPLYNVTLKLEQARESRQVIGLSRIWKSLKHSLAWKLLWLCRHGNKEQRNIALEQLAAFKNNKSWDCCRLAQAMDKNTAVLLARTRGADQRYFLPAPIHVRRAALSSELLSFKFRDLIVAVQKENPHYCIQHFTNKYFMNVHEQVNEPVTDCVASKPDTASERELCILCLDALYHHLTIFHSSVYEEDASVNTLINMGLLPILAESLLRNRDDPDFDLAVLKILTVLSIHTDLLTAFYQNGFIRELSRLLGSPDIRLSSSAAVCLANLSGEHRFRPGLYLLHPIYRTTKVPSCDTLLVHGLRGGVFVTWRQRDKKCAEPIGIIEVTMSDFDCLDPLCDAQPITSSPEYLDPDLRQVMEDLIQCEDEATLSDLEIVLHDIPTVALREPQSNQTYLAQKKRLAMIEEQQDKCSHTLCWPKDWLPRDCDNLRVLGVNYWTSLSEWFETCPLQSADIATRASNLVPAILDAGVGTKDTGVVWLAHSMGGLIVKQALVIASKSNDEELKRISENTKAILFFSTPHKGSSVASMPRAAAAVLWPSNDVKQLQENSPTLLELHKKFIEFANVYNWETISFAESLPTLVTAFKVPVHFVEAYSADLGRGVFYQLPLDHLSICKPATRQSVLYTTVLDVLQRACTKEVKNEHFFLQRLLHRLYCLIRNKILERLQLINETQATIDSEQWFDKIILSSCIDDFYF